MNRRKKWLKVVPSVALLLVISLAAGGCEPLRKKFTRAKKKDADTVDAFVPVLEPEAYPEKVYSATEDYKYRYSLWQVWSRELETALTDKLDAKRQNYILDQAVAQVDVMKKLLNADKQTGIDAILNDLHKMQEKLRSPLPMRDDFAILRDLDSVGRKMRENYKFDKVESSIAQ